MDRTTVRSSGGWSGSSGIHEQASVLAQPSARMLIAWTGPCDQTPEVMRMVRAPQVHQLMDENVVANRFWHQHKAPVQADVTGGRARSPARSLIPYAHARHLQVVIRRQTKQMRRQLAGSLPAQILDGLGRQSGTLCRVLLHFRPLALYPGTLLLGEKLGMTHGSPSRNGDADASVRPDANDISPGSRMPDEFHERITIVPGMDSE